TSADRGTTWSAQKLLAPEPAGHQFFPYLTASGGRVSAIWYDSAGDPDYAPTRAPCNTAAGRTAACLNVRYAQSTDGGKTWAPAIQVTAPPTTPNYEQSGGRLVPFFGDYITVAAQGGVIGAVWTDQRNTAAATSSPDGADVSGDPADGGACTSTQTAC